MPTFTCKSRRGHCEDWIRLNPCPESGSGQRLVHRWLFSAAQAFRLRGVSVNECRDLLEQNASRRVPPREMADTLRRVYSEAAGVQAAAKKPEIPPFDPELLSRYAGSVSFRVDRDWLDDHSPQCVFCVRPSDFLDSVFRLGESAFVTVNQKSKDGFVYRIGNSIDADELNQFTRNNVGGCWFLSQPVDGIERDNSVRSEANVTSWRYLVLESDKAPADQWLAMLVQLRLPITAIYTSGNRSIHALVRVDCESKAEFDEIRDSLRSQLTPVGADPNAMSAVRLTRLPSVRRADNRQMQQLLFLNPQPTDKPIYVRE